MDEETFGIDWDGPLPNVTCDTHVEVSSIEMPLTNREYRELCEEIDPLAESNEHGIDIYLNCLQFVRRKLSTHVA